MSTIGRRLSWNTAAMRRAPRQPTPASVATAAPRPLQPQLPAIGPGAAPAPLSDAAKALSTGFLAGTAVFLLAQLLALPAMAGLLGLGACLSVGAALAYRVQRPFPAREDHAAAQPQVAFAWRDLPDDVQNKIIGHFSPAQAAAWAVTGGPENRLVQCQPYVRRRLLGTAQGPLPKYSHTVLHRLVAPYGGLAATGALIEQIHARGEVLDDDALFGAPLRAWADQEVATGAAEEALRQAVENMHAVRQGLSSSLRFANLPIKTLPPLTGLKALEVLSLFCCNNLTSLPERLAELPALETLSVYECTDLRSLPEGLGKLTALKTLSVYGCASLRSLPESLGALTALKTLSLEHCTKLASLPESLGSLTALSTLYLWGCTGLASLPERLGELAALETLDFRGCTGLTSLPDRLGELKALEKLDLYGCINLRSLPECLDGLTALENLDLWDCSSLTSLPERLGELTALEKLHLCGCIGLTTLPASLGQLTALTRLLVLNCPGLRPAVIQAAKKALPGCCVQHD